MKFLVNEALQDCSDRNEQKGPEKTRAIQGREIFVYGVCTEHRKGTEIMVREGSDSSLENRQ